MNKPYKSKLIDECRRQEESCLYTSTTFYIWLRSIRRWKGVFIIVPIFLGSVSSWAILDSPGIPWLTTLTAISALVAGLLPAIRDGLSLDIHADDVTRLAATFKGLQDKFRLLSEIGEFKSESELETELRSLIKQLDTARKISLTPPERCFIQARRKIQNGHYSFTLDGHDTANDAARP